MFSSISSQSAIKSTHISDIHPEIIATHILTQIDVRSLASIALASPEFHALCNQEKVWTELCSSNWTSTKHSLVQKLVSTFPGGYYSFFFDSLPVLHFDTSKNQSHDNTAFMQTADQLISCVDIQYRNNTIFSQVEVTNTSSTDMLLDSVFKVQVLDNNNNNKNSLSFLINCEEDADIYLSDLKENMTLSWIMIDPTQKRAANLSSQKPVSVRPHWVDGDIEVKYAIIMSEFVEMRITAMLRWGDGGKSLKLSSVKLQLHDIDNMCLSGKQSVRILQQAIQNGTRKKAKTGEETKIHKKYLHIKWERREGKQKRSRGENIAKQLIVIICVVMAIVTVQCFLGLGY